MFRNYWWGCSKASIFKYIWFSVLINWYHKQWNMYYMFSYLLFVRVQKKKKKRNKKIYYLLTKCIFLLRIHITSCIQERIQPPDLLLATISIYIKMKLNISIVCCINFCKSINLVKLKCERPGTKLGPTRQLPLTCVTSSL